MSCPDWHRLAADRRAGAGDAEAPEPAGWHEALAHLDGCDGCRDEALAEDPVLLFRRLPAVEADAAAVDDVRAGVAALRRAHRVAGGIDRPRRVGGRRGSLRWWGRAAAALVLTAGLLGLRPDVEDPQGPPAGAWSASLPPSIAQMERATAFAVDDIEHPTASVYHFDDEDLGVVMVVDAGLDV